METSDRNEDGVKSPNPNAASAASTHTLPYPAKPGAVTGKQAVAPATEETKRSAGKDKQSAVRESKGSTAGKNKSPANTGSKKCHAETKNVTQSHSQVSTLVQKSNKSVTGKDQASSQPNKPQSQIAMTTISTMKTDIKDVNSRLDRLESMLTKVVEHLPSASNSRQGATHDDVEYDEYDTEVMGHNYDPEGSISVADMEIENRGFDMEDDNDREAHPIESTEVIEETVPALAAKFAIRPAVGHTVNDNIARSALYMLDTQLDEKSIAEASEKYPPPSNCGYLDVPKVNNVIWDKLSQSTRGKDLKLQRVQKSLTRGISAYIQTLSSMPNLTLNDGQQDSLALLCNANIELNALRKDLIRPEINPQYAHLCKPANPVTKNLFGDDLSKRVKDLRDEQRAASGVIKGQAKSSVRHRYQYQPYDFKTPRRQYERAGWTTSQGHKSSNTNRPFLGQRPWSQRRRPPPATQSRPPPQRKAAPSQRK